LSLDWSLWRIVGLVVVLRRVVFESSSEIMRKNLGFVLVDIVDFWIGLNRYCYCLNFQRVDTCFVAAGIGVVAVAVVVGVVVVVEASLYYLIR
jgi:hypothetical protein